MSAGFVDTLKVIDGRVYAASKRPVSLADLDAAIVTAGTTYSAENKDAAPIPAGGACAVHSSGVGCVRACAADDTRPAVGLAQAATAVGAAAAVQTGGAFRLADWSAVVGAVKLAPKAVYFVDPANPGKLTATRPTATGQVLQVVGVAVSVDTLDLDPSGPVLL